MALVMLTASVTKAATTLEDISRAYASHDAAIDSIRIDYTARYDLLGDAEVVFKCWRRLSFPDDSFTLAAGRNGVHFKVIRVDRSPSITMSRVMSANPSRFAGLSGDVTDHISYSEVAKVLPGVPTESTERILVYDGSIVREKSPRIIEDLAGDRAMYFLKDASKSKARIFQTNYLDMTLHGFNIEGLPRDSEARSAFRLPDLFLNDDYQVVSESEVIDGTTCVVVESKGKDRLWFDPAVGFALRRRQELSNESLVQQVECKSFVSVTNGVWMPQTVVKIEFGDDRVPPEHHGKPLVRTTFDATVLEVNRPDHAALFVLEPEAGSNVADLRIVPLGKDGVPLTPDPKSGAIPVVSYTQPANPSDIEKVAKLAQGRHRVRYGLAERGASSWLRATFLWLNVAVGIAVCCVVFARWSKNTRQRIVPGDKT